jgi:hypothetical protein
MRILKAFVLLLLIALVVPMPQAAAESVGSDPGYITGEVSFPVSPTKPVHNRRREEDLQ